MHDHALIRTPRKTAFLGVLLLLVAALAAFVAFAPKAPAALGGPVIIGGDDLTDHGFYDSSTDENKQGWLYIQKALENIKPNVKRVNDGSVAALGSAAGGGGAGAAILSAATKAGFTVTYYNGDVAIGQFFTDLGAGTAKPAVVWIAGTGAGNDLDGGEATALTNNATSLGDFVNAGGGLMSHGSEFGWLFGLLPNASAAFSGSSNDLYLTTDGTAAFPGLTNADVNAGPWHNHFEGDFGGLKVLVRSTNQKDRTGADAPVIIGGSSVSLPGSITLDPPSATNLVGTTHTVKATVRNNQGAVQPGVQVTFTVTAGPNAGDTGQGTTDTNGETTFSWVGDGGTGQDTVEASFVDATGNTRTATATKDWVTECADGADNDGDGKIDFAADGSGDPDCTAADDPSESAPPSTECSDGVDNDGDGAIDGFDRDCTGPEDFHESGSAEPECSDGVDNDGDGKIDFAADGSGDPDCVDDDDDSESPVPPQCSDGIDNDGDGLIDFADDGTGDPGCESPEDDDETDAAGTCDDADGDGTNHSEFAPDQNEDGLLSGLVHEVDQALAAVPVVSGDGGVVPEVNCAVVKGVLGL